MLFVGFHLQQPVVVVVVVAVVAVVARCCRQID